MTRTRPALSALLALAALGLLVGCGDDDTTAATDGAPTAGAEGSGAFPVTVDHAFGRSVVEHAPQRVVSLGFTEQDAIVALGVEPVAVRYAFGSENDVYFPWADDLVQGDDPEILPRAEVDPEQVAALDPDLILAVTAGLTEDEYDLLSQIAPVVVQPEGFPAFGTPWQDQTRITGRALGREAEAEALVAEVEARFDEVVAEHPELDGVTIALSGPMYNGEYPFHTAEDTRTRFFLDLGMVVPDELEAEAGDELFYGTVSQERADLLDADVLVFQAGSPAEREALETDEILAGLPVVRDGRSLFVDGATYDALQFSSVLSLPFLLDELVPELAEVAERVDR